MKYSEVKNPKWGNAEHSIIDCEVNFERLNEEFVPFSASANDICDHSKDIFVRAVAGEFGTINDYEELVISSAEKASIIRGERQSIFSMLDIVVSNPLRWAEFTDAEKAEIAAYRQALLDITKQPSFPEFVEWPKKPSVIK